MTELKPCLEPRLIYAWVVPEDHPNFTGHDDLPVAYRVWRCDEYAGGVMIEAKWKNRDKWDANPSSIRPLVRHLIGRVGESNSALKEFKEMTDSS